MLGNKQANQNSLCKYRISKPTNKPDIENHTKDHLMTRQREMATRTQSQPYEMTWVAQSDRDISPREHAQVFPHQHAHAQAMS